MQQTHCAPMWRRCLLLLIGVKTALHLEVQVVNSQMTNANNLPPPSPRPGPPDSPRLPHLHDLVRPLLLH